MSLSLLSVYAMHIANTLRGLHITSAVDIDWPHISLITEYWNKNTQEMKIQIKNQDGMDLGSFIESKLTGPYK